MYPYPLQYGFAAYTIKKWHLFSQPLTLGWVQEVLWLMTKHGRGDGLLVLSWGLEEALYASACSLWTPAFTLKTRLRFLLEDERLFGIDMLSIRAQPKRPLSAKLPAEKTYVSKPDTKESLSSAQSKPLNYRVMK